MIYLTKEITSNSTHFVWTDFVVLLHPCCLCSLFCGRNKIIMGLEQQRIHFWINNFITSQDIFPNLIKHLLYTTLVTVLILVPIMDNLIIDI